jgi:hypothetical protein
MPLLQRILDIQELRNTNSTFLNTAIQDYNDLTISLESFKQIRKRWLFQENLLQIDVSHLYHVAYTYRCLE